VNKPHIKSDELETLSDLAPEIAKMFVALDGDIVLIVGQDGVIQNVSMGAAIRDHTSDKWIGRHWAETVTGSTRRKIELLLQEVDVGGVTRRREVNHQSSVGTDIPVSYSALRLGKLGPVIAVGRDLRTVAAIQQQMISAQQELERNYWTLRRDQGQRRELNQVASDAVLVVTGAKFQIFKSNAAASTLLLQADTSLCLQLKELLDKAMQGGNTVAVRTRLKGKGQDGPLLDIFVTPFRSQESADAPHHLLVRARRVGNQDAVPADIYTAVTDTQGRILMASDALVAMCANGGANSLYGKSLSSLLDSTQGVLARLPQLVLRDGMADISSTILGGNVAPTCEAEVSATLIADGDQQRIGVCLRVQTASNINTLTQTLQSLLTSRLPLENLLQQVLQLTERQAVFDALSSTGANMVATAHLLSISVADLSQRLERLDIDRAQFTAH
jgi:transcriptional regulator PpsR